MPTYIALLRGINVGGNVIVPMSDLLELVTELGFEDAKTLLQSGNLVFRAAAKSAPALERQLEAATEKRFGRPITYMVRRSRQWGDVVARNPFPDEAARDPAHLVATFLKDAPAATTEATLRAAIEGPETIHLDGDHLYVYYPAGMGRSQLTNKLIEDKLCTRATARNWNTVLKLAALAATRVDGG